MQQAIPMRAYYSWLEYVDKRVFLRKFLKRIISRHEKKEIAKGFSGWTSFLAQEKLEDSEKQLALQARKQLVKKMMGSPFLGAFRRWLEYVDDRKFLRRTMLRVVYRKDMQGQICAMNTWRAYLNVSRYSKLNYRIKSVALIND